MNASEEAKRDGGSGAVGWEPWLVTALLVLANLPLLTGRPATALVFFPDRVACGEWWRILTYPLPHVSWYHLLLDGAAFLQLIASLGELGRGHRYLIVLGGGAGSLLLPLAVPSPIRQVGVCGLSGIDHGLMAVAGALLLKAEQRKARWQGGFLLAAVVLKAFVETLTGHILFESLHLGSLGVPVAACHLGGILGSLAVLGLLQAARASIGERTANQMPAASPT